MSSFLVINGPSGVGKSTLIKHLLKNSAFKLSISYTTRCPRANETDGVEYYFVTVEEFKKMIENGSLLEYTVFNNNYYGTPSHSDSDASFIIFDLEIDGFRFFKWKHPDSYFCLVTAPKETLKLRLRSRMESLGKGIDESEIESRLKVYDVYESIRDQYDFVVDNSFGLGKLLQQAQDLIEILIRKSEM